MKPGQALTEFLISMIMTVPFVFGAFLLNWRLWQKWNCSVISFQKARQSAIRLSSQEDEKTKFFNENILQWIFSFKKGVHVKTIEKEQGILAKARCGPIKEKVFFPFLEKKEKKQ